MLSIDGRFVASGSSDAGASDLDTDGLLWLGQSTDMYYLLDTVPPIRVVCKNVATVNIPQQEALLSRRAQRVRLV